MKAWPEFNEHGDLPIGIYTAALNAVVEHFGTTPRRAVVARRLERIYQLARSTGQLARFILFGSFVTAKPEPNDVDIFLLMEDSFDVRQVSTEARLVFDHAAAQNLLGASVFGFVAPPRSAVKMRLSLTGKPSATETNAASWR